MTFVRSRSSHARGLTATVAALACLLAAAHVFAAPAASSAEPAPEPATEVEPEPGSPRAAVQRYLELCRSERYAEAGAYLDSPKLDERERRTLARRLKAVLDRHAWPDLEKVSDRQEGSLSDGLPAAYEQVGAVPRAGGARDPVRLVRRSGDRGWAFSRSTVARINGWYDSLPDRWLLENLPSALLRQGPRGLLWWQWLGLLLLATGSAAVGLTASTMLRRLLVSAAKRTSAGWDDRVFIRMRGPVALAFSLVLARGLLPFLLLYAPAEDFIRAGLRGGFLVTLLWVFWRLVDVTAQAAWDSSWSRAHAASRALIPLLRRTGKAVVSVVAVLLLLTTLGYPVTSLIAGLGIGGLALALASQKTVENLFGAFSLGIDQPFREGDFVRIDDLIGTVESLGLRSTKIRTLDRTLVSIPNGKLAEMRLETFAARDRLRLACTIGLVYGTSAQQLQTVLSGLEGVLRAHPKLWPDSLTVRFKELGSSSLDIEIMAWFTTSDWDEFMLIRQEILLGFMNVVEKSGTSFAFPTRTVHLAPGTRVVAAAAE